MQRPLIPVLALVAIVIVAVARPAAADCAGPSVVFSPHQVDRGSEVTVTGRRWGSDCYDTGPPPDGEGVLGAPLRGIELVVVQGDQQWVVGTVDAGEDYRWATRVIVPPDAAPGEAQLIARHGDRTWPYVSNPDPTLHISDATPVEVSAPTGSDGASTHGDSDPQDSVDASSPRWWVVAPLGAAALAAVAVVVHRRAASTASAR